MQEIVVALIAFLGTMLGTFGGIITSSKLTNYRIEQLEKKVDKHNSFATRIPLLESEISELKAITETLEKYHMEKI